MLADVPELNLMNTYKMQKMDKLPVAKYLDQLRFVFYTSFLLCFSLLFLDYIALRGGRSGITYLLNNFTKSKHAHEPKPSSFLSNLDETTTDCPEKTSGSSDQDQTLTNGVSDIQRNVIENHTETLFVLAPNEGNKKEQMGPSRVTNLDPCSGQHIYMYDLPSRFNKDLLKSCHSLSKWIDMCPYITNLGLGPKVTEKTKGRVLLRNSWYATNQFSLEVIFHNKMKHYRCLTNNSSLASAIFVPYYAGLDVGQYLWGFNVSVRDASPKELAMWLSKQPEWKRMWGRDHFLVGGRIGWDFRRRTEDYSDWGTKLMFLPEVSNMSLLPIESGSYDNDFSIPYPTYFHPSTDREVSRWQKSMRRVKRPYLFSFVGAPRPNSTEPIRRELIKHCHECSKSCKFLGCYTVSNPCDKPANVIKVLQSSDFCLQPPGDSFTRKSTFDSILAGCIPVFFHPGSAYDQYLWHLPRNGSRYSVFIPEEDVIEKRVKVNEALLRVPKSEVLALREEVIRLIPRIIYGNPRFRLKNTEDAFDIAVKGILGRIETIIRRDILNVKDPSSKEEADQ